MRERGKGAILNVASTAAFQAGPEHGGLLCAKAYRPLLHRGAAPRIEGQRHPRLLPLPRPDESEFGEVAGSKSPALERIKGPAAPVVRAGLKGLDSNKAIVIPGLPNKLTAQINRILPRAAMRRIVGRIKV